MVEAPVTMQIIKPLLEVVAHVEDQPLSSATAEEPLPTSTGPPSVEPFMTQLNPSHSSDMALTCTPSDGFKVGPDDFSLLCVIGQGAFGRVLQVRGKFDNQVYAMKVISKKMLSKKNHVAYMKAERDILTKVDFPFVVGLNFSFQTEEKLFLVMRFLSGGELFFHLRKQGLILEDTARFYIAEMVLAIEHLHSRGIIHRDLKPENVLLGGDGHICLTDFGLAKEITMEEDEQGRARTVCGTNEYMAPEMITKKGYGKAVDWWSVGILMYEMMAGSPPFRAKTLKELNHKILHDKITLPKWLSSEAHSIMRGFLERNVQKRLGSQKGNMFEIGGVTVLKNHKFFNKIDWQGLVRKQVPVPFVPNIESDLDTRNFDEEFTKMELSTSLVELEDLPGTHSETYKGFSFIAPSFDLDSIPTDYHEIRLACKEKPIIRIDEDEALMEPDLFSDNGRKTVEKEKKKKKKSPNRKKSPEPPALKENDTQTAVKEGVDESALAPSIDKSREEVKAAVELDVVKDPIPQVQPKESPLVVAPVKVNESVPVKSTLRPTVPEFVPTSIRSSPTPPLTGGMPTATPAPTKPVAPARPAPMSWSNVVKKPTTTEPTPSPKGNNQEPAALKAPIGVDSNNHPSSSSTKAKAAVGGAQSVVVSAPVEEEWTTVGSKKAPKGKASKK